MRQHNHKAGPKFCKWCGFERPLDDFPYSAGQYRFLCKEHWDEYCAEQRELHREKQRAYDRERYAKNPEESRRRARLTGERRRLACLTHYGGNPPQCACCGEATLEFLCLDHINGGGEQHRQQVHSEGKTFYRWIIDNGFPPIFRVLCHNCNAALGHYGYCPHGNLPKVR